MSLPTLPGYELPNSKQMDEARPALRDFLNRKCLIASLWMVLAAGLVLLVPWCLVHVVDDGISGQDFRQLIAWALAAAFCQAASGAFRYFGECRITRCALDAEKQCMTSLFSKSMHSDLRYLPELAQGRAMGQIIFASGSEKHFLETLYTQGIPLIITAVGTFAALLTLSWKLLCLSLVLCPLALGLWWWMKNKIRPAARAEYETQEHLYRHIVDTFRAMISIRALHQEERFVSNFEATCQNCLNAMFRLRQKLAVQGPYFDALQALAIAAVFGAGGYGALHGEITIGAILGFQIYLARMFGIMRSGTGLFGAWQQYIEGRARASDIIRLPKAQTTAYLKAKSPELLRLEHVSFAFDTHEVWNDKSMTICEGEYQAILLPSGGGKTTLARCILGLYPISSGTIAIPDASAECIGFVPQENVLFNGTIQDNILMLNPELSTEKYHEILYICELEELANRFEQDSIGDQGSRLSGGEQRRVMLARSLAGNPKLLIIDQMASELEPDLCHRIFSRMHEKFPKLGVLYLGHRMPEWERDK